MKEILKFIERWIGPKWSSLIAFAAIYGVSLPDLDELVSKGAEYVGGNPELLVKGGVAAFIAYVFRSARVMDPAVVPGKTIEVEVAGRRPTVIQTPVPAVTPLVEEESRNWFSDAELDCKCQDLPGCDYKGMSPVLIAIINDLRNHFGVLIVNSGYRCPAHNRAIGSKDTSYHPRGKAVDLKSPTVAPSELYAYLDSKYPSKYGFGLYERFVHIDCRSPAWARKPAPEQPWKQFFPDIPL